MAQTPTKKLRKPEKSSAREPATRKRVLIEFSSALLRKADDAASEAKQTRSQFIRSAVDAAVFAEEKRRFQQELGEAYVANAHMGEEAMRDFEHVDNEGW